MRKLYYRMGRIEEQFAALRNEGNFPQSSAVNNPQSSANMSVCLPVGLPINTVDDLRVLESFAIESSANFKILVSCKLINCFVLTYFSVEILV